MLEDDADTPNSWSSLKVIQKNMCIDVLQNDINTLQNLISCDEL